MKIGLVGDYNATYLAHQAIPKALALASQQLGISVAPEWIPTDAIGADAVLSDCDGIWCVPGSPYRSMEGALRAIRVARETNRPFLGTCGGFQHAVIEYARNVLQWADAEHAETAPAAERTVIAPLSCSLVEKSGVVRFVEGSQLARAYGTLDSDETYHCNYGLNPVFADTLTTGPLRQTAVDIEGAIRGVELTTHPFFVGTLFQPERAALQGIAPPLVMAFPRSVR